MWWGISLIVQDKIVGSIIVSGLEHDRDHQLIVDAIRNFKNKIAFASDVDGTLMFHDREDNYKSQDLIKIRTFQEEGNYFGICTGRPMCFIGDMINLGLDFYIMSSGAVMLDKNLKIIKDYPIDHTSVQHIFEDYKESACLIIQTGNLKTSYGNKVLNPEVDFIKIDSVDEIKEETFYGISIIVDNEEMASIIANDINSQYKDLIGYQNINSVDIVHRGCSKGEAIKQIKGLLNVNKIVAIGDSFNDISMLKESDISFTFHNSANEVKEHADEIVDSIAEAIMKLSR